MYWHVRAVAVFGIVFLALAAWAWQRRERFPWLLRGCAGLLALLLAQMAIGEVQYRTYGTVPWGVVVVHVVARSSAVRMDGRSGRAALEARGRRQLDSAGCRS